MENGIDTTQHQGWSEIYSLGLGPMVQARWSRPHGPMVQAPWSHGPGPMVPWSRPPMVQAQAPWSHGPGPHGPMVQAPWSRSRPHGPWSRLSLHSCQPSHDDIVQQQHRGTFSAVVPLHESTLEGQPGTHSPSIQR